LNKPIVSLKNVSFQYNPGENYALHDVSFEVDTGEWLAIVGHNGSGKSTTAKLLNGLQFPQQGEITVAGLKLSEETVWEVRKKVGMVFQNPDNQFVGTTVEDDVAFGLENNGIEREEMIHRVMDSLKRVKMDQFLSQEPHHLSGGQKQRVAIAGVLAFRELKAEKGLTVISITHDLEEASKADRIIVMNKGKVYREGTPEEIFSMEEELMKLGLDIPFSVKMSNAVREQGFPLSKQYLSEEELVTELWTFRSNK
jgi:energy-coupling factor transport system ATP-binding protein